MKQICLTPKEKEFLSKAKPVEDMKGDNLSKEIIKGIAIGGAVASMFILPGIAIGYRWIEDLHKNHKRRLRDNLKRLTEKGYLIQRDEKYFLTPKGKLKLYEYEIEDLTIPKPQKWDSTWRIITFDIPEEKRVARLALNKKLKNLGFITLQKSVFIYPHPCEEEFMQIGKFFGIEKNIVFIKANKISNEREIKQKFKKVDLL